MPIPTIFSASGSAGRVWEAILERAKAKGQSEKDLQREIDVGYTEDSHLLPRTYNKRGSVEAEEVFEYAYSHPEFYPVLARAGLPVPFGFLDYNPKTLYDDQLWHELESWDKEAAVRVAKRFASNSDGYIRELSRVIFEDSLRRFSKTGDCAIEKTAAEAAQAHCGACTEGSNQLYARYMAAGLAPKFLFFQNWKPSLEWLDLVRNRVNAQSHILVGVPLHSGGLLQVDLINRQFEARYSTAVQITPRQYLSAWLGNRAMGHTSKGQLDQALADTETIWTIAANATTAFIHSLAVFIQKQDWDEADQAMTRLELIAPNGPEHFFLRSHLTLHRQDQLTSEREAAITATNAQIPAMLVKYPGPAAFFLFSHAQMNAAIVKQYAQTRPDKNSPVPKDIQEAASFALHNYYASLGANPRYPFAYKGLLEFIEAADGWEQGVDVFEQLLKKHPHHPPFLYAAALCHFRQWQGTGRKDAAKLTAAWEHMEALMGTAEPGNPRAHPLAADILVAREQSADILPMMRRGLAQWKEQPPWVEYYRIYLMAVLGAAGDPLEMVAVAKKGLATYGAGLSQSFSADLYAKTEMRIEGDLPVAEVTRLAQSHAQRLLPLMDILDGYSEAHPHLDGIRVITAVFLDMAGEGDTAAATLSKIRNPNRPEVQVKLAYFDGQFQKWLSNAPLTQPEMLQRITQFLKQSEHLAGPLLQGKRAALHSHCARQFLKLGMTEAAQNTWGLAVETETASAIDSAMALYNTMRAHPERLAWLNVIASHKDRLAPAVLQWLTTETASQTAQLSDAQ